MAAYVERYIAFVDLIAFKDLVSRSLGATPEVSVDSIRSILDIAPPLAPDLIVLGRIGDIARSGHRLTAFSDSIVITTENTEQGLMHLLHHVETIGFRLARLGTLYRGGVVRGFVYHDEGQVFGPGVIEAYEIEKKAEFPRVVLSATVVAEGRSAAPPVRQVFEGFTQTDSDGSVFVHYLRILQAIAESDGPLPDDARALHKEIESTISKQLTRVATDPTKKLKWEWFQAYFRRAIDESWRQELLTPLTPLFGD